ncbi:hypothetical protein MMC29_002876, partial [Sticta canariensis]|nr:hypothetical protein [Sticta canariensis]
MTIRANKFTPEVLLSAPRRSAAVPNQDGTLALYTVATYSFRSHKKTAEIKVLNIKNGQSNLVTNDEKAREPVWLGHGNELIWLKEGEKGATQLIHGDADDIGTTYIVGVVPGPVSNLKLRVLGDGKAAIAVVGKARPDGSLYNPELEPKKYSSARVYDSLMVRHWDTYVTPNRNAIWYGSLEKLNGRFTASNLTNALKNTQLESPIPVFGGTNHFDIAGTGVVFVAKDPTLNPAANTKSSCYYLPVSSFSAPPSQNLQKFVVKGLEGASTGPVLSPNGVSAAFLQMRQNGYESDKNQIVLIPDIREPSIIVEVLKSNDGKGLWDRSPSAISWSQDGRSLYLRAEEHGKGLLFHLDIPATPLDINELPRPLTNSGHVSDVKPLSADSPLLFVSSSNLIDNSFYTVIDPSKPSNARQISSDSRNGTSFKLSNEQVSDIWFKGSGDYKVHAWVLKPSNFTEGKKYPLAYLIHGGPQGAWNDEWNTRWNPAVFAEQGYVVITPNPTGSTGYGQAFCDAIRNSWGGLPYEDLVNGFSYIKENLDFVDTSRSVALGASYGGYMMNWIQGHPLGREFKALVCHDGVFSMANQISSDEQYFPNHEFGGPFWTAIKNWERWDPVRFTGEWATPQLVIHNALDYRLPISEGLAAFNVLQERGVESRFLSFPDENHW